MQGGPDASDGLVIGHDLLVKLEAVVTTSLDTLPELFGDLRYTLVSHVDGLGLAVVVVKDELRVTALLFNFKENVLVI